MQLIFTYPSSSIYSTYSSVYRTFFPGMLLIISFLINPNLFFIIRYKHPWLCLPICKHSLTEIHMISLWVALLGLWAKIHLLLSLCFALYHSGEQTRAGQTSQAPVPTRSQLDLSNGRHELEPGARRRGAQVPGSSQSSHCCLMGPAKSQLLSGDLRPWFGHATSHLHVLSQRNWSGLLMALSSRAPLLYILKRGFSFPG